MSVSEVECRLPIAQVEGEKGASCLVSFVVIARNEEEVIAACIESVFRAAEHLPSWECIFVDSASEDSTVDIVMRYPVTVIRLLPGQRMTPAAGRHVGIRYARGRYIMFVDGDCELEAGFVVKAVHTLQGDENIAGVFGTRGYRYNRERQTEQVAEPAAVEWWDGVDSDATTMGGVALLRKASLDNVGGHNPFMRSEEERELCLRLRHAGYRIRQISAPMMLHNSRPGQTKFAFSESYRRYRGGLLDGRGQLLRLAVSHGVFSPDYVIDGTRRNLGFIGLFGLGLLSASVSLAFQSLYPLLGWLAFCALTLVAFAWSIGCPRRAFFYAGVSFLESAALLRGFARGCLDASKYSGRYEMLKQTETPFGNPMDGAGSANGCPARDSADPEVQGHPDAASEMEKPDRMPLLLAGPFAPRGVVSGGMEKQLDIFVKLAAPALRITVFDTQHGGRDQHSTLGRIVYAPLFVANFARRVLASKAPVVQIRTTSEISFWKSGVCGIVARLLGRKVVLSIHAPDMVEFFEERSALGKSAIRWVLENCDRLVALSDGWQKTLSGMAPRARIVVLPNGVEDEYFHCAPERQAAPDDRVRLLFIGGGSWSRSIDKGFLDVVKALRVAGLGPKCVLTAAGSIDESAKAELTDLNVIYPGIVSTEQKLALFRDTDVFVQPSHLENMPNVILEAMGAGVPIVATSVGAIPEMVDGKRGALLTETEDVEALAEAISCLVQDADLRLQMGQNNYQRARQRYHVETTVASWIALLLELGTEKSSPVRRSAPMVTKS